MSVEILAQLPSGALANPQLNYNKVAIVQNEFARLAEKGKVFSTTHQTVGIITQAGLSGTAAILSLHNPAGSGVVGRLWYAGMALEVKVPGAHGAALRDEKHAAEWPGWINQVMPR